MPDVSQADIGRRMYHLHKEKNIERAVALLRQHLGSDWKNLAEADIHLLEQVLGDVWVGLDRNTWEKIPFEHMSRNDVDRILAVAKTRELEKRSKIQATEEIRNVLLAVR